VTLARLWTVLAVLLPVLGALVARLSTVDLAYHLRAGEEILAARTVPTVDSWTFTAAGLPWVDQQWGAQVIFRAVESLGGWTGVVVARAALVGWIFGGLASLGRRRGLDARTSALLALAAFVVASPALALRPQLLGMACFVAVLLLVSERRRAPRLVWLAPVVIAVWANLHGSFVLGPVVLGLAWLEDIGDRARASNRTLAVVIAGALAACLTPSGPLVWVYAVGLSVDPEVTARITEWQPTSLRDIAGLLFFASALGIVALIARRGVRVAWPTLAWLGVFFLIGAYAERGVAWWPLGAVAAIAGTVVPPVASAAPLRPDRPFVRRLNAVLVGALVLAGIALLPTWRSPTQEADVSGGVVSPAPAGITAAVRDVARSGDRLFHPQPWGSWFEYAIRDLPVVIDSRIELFPAEVWDRFEAVEAGVDGWRDILDAWSVTIVVTRAADSAFADRLAAAGWVRIHADPDGGVFVRPDR
jgi:hypothetical protein